MYSIIEQVDKVMLNKGYQNTVSKFGKRTAPNENVPEVQYVHVQYCASVHIEQYHMVQYSIVNKGQ